MATRLAMANDNRSAIMGPPVIQAMPLERASVHWRGCTP
jgi:hypothetical protein